MTMRRVVLAVVLLAGATGLAWATRSSRIDVPTAEARIGDFEDAIEVRGTVKSERSVPVVAPESAGNLQIVRLARTGTMVRTGDVVVRFDASTVQRTVAEKQSELRGLDSELAKVTSDAHTKEEAAITAEAAARTKLETARLDYSAAPILPRVEAEQRRLAVVDQEHALAAATAALASARAGAAADMAAARHKREKARRDLELAQGRLSRLELRAPADGMVSVLQNTSVSFDNPPEFREGDRVWPGATIMELPDIHALQVVARVEELDRARLSEGQRLTVRMEAVPDRTLSGRIASISPLAKADFSTWPPPRTFEVTASIDEADARVRPGMNAMLRVRIETLTHVLLIPAQALFSRDGADVVYTADRTFEPHPVHVLRRGPENVALRDGIAPGARVSLVDPQRRAGGAR